jgi:GMP synthase-like glutamine amidotransferase
VTGLDEGGVASAQSARPRPPQMQQTPREPFVAAVENGPLWATQFHPEKSGDSGAQLLRNWIGSFQFSSVREADCLVMGIPVV